MATGVWSVSATLMQAFKSTHPHLVWWSTKRPHDCDLLSMRCGRCRCTVSRDIESDMVSANDSTVMPLVKSMLDQHDLECDELNELAVDSRVRLKLGEAPRSNYEYAEAMATAYMAVADELSKGKLVKA